MRVLFQVVALLMLIALMFIVGITILGCAVNMAAPIIISGVGAFVSGLFAFKVDLTNTGK